MRRDTNDARRTRDTCWGVADDCCTDEGTQRRETYRDKERKNKKSRKQGTKAWKSLLIWQTISRSIRSNAQFFLGGSRHVLTIDWYRASRFGHSISLTDPKHLTFFTFFSLRNDPILLRSSLAPKHGCCSVLDPLHTSDWSPFPTSLHRFRDDRFLAYKI